MNPPSSILCPACGVPLDAGSTGPCPRCLLVAAMQPTDPGELAAPRPALTPEELAPHFPQLEILDCLGRGGMGVVYKARQKSLHRLVALKLLPASLAERDAAFADRFEREGQLLARLHHPNIVAVHDSGTAGGFFYLIMEYVDGVNLRQAMRARRFTPGQALAIVPRICDALQFAHDEGVLHRDIKPENILIDAKGRVKLADFGIAKLLGSDPDPAVRASAGQAEVPGLTQSGTALGTPSYMSPEQRETPADVDHRADIYSLGVVFYELLTGELPQGPLARPSEKSTADPRVDAIVQQALETERDRRQHSAGEVKTQVETIVGSSAASPAAQVAASEGIATPPRFSRMAIVGACWAPVFFIFFPLYFTQDQASAGEYHGPTLWQKLAAVVLGGLGITAPIGATILGWVAVSLIRRSAGSLHGLWLAVLDGLLFPLLALTGLIGWFWNWVFSDLLRAYLSAGEPQLSPIKRILLTNTTAFTVVATLLTSLVVSFFIIGRVWRTVKPPAETSVAALPPESRSGCLRVVAILGFAGLAIFAVMLPVYFLADAPSPATSASSHFPKFAHIGRNHHSVEVVHDGSDLHYVFYYAGDFGSSSSGSQNVHSLTWMDEGSIKLGNGRTFGYHRESTGPEQVRVNGAEYELRRGRVLVLGESGAVEQLALFPPLTTARDPEELAKLIASARAMNAEPITVEKLRHQREAAEAQLADALKTCAPTHPFVIEVEGNIESLRQKFGKQAVPPTFESVTGAARKLISTNFPDAVIHSEPDEFTALHATQEFEIHTQFKTGEVAQKAQKQTGPSAGGFMLTVQRLKAPLVSAAADLPQSFDRPYWKSYVNSSFDPKTGQGVAVYFDFGARLDPEFKRALLELLQLRDQSPREARAAAALTPSSTPPFANGRDAR